MTRQIKSIIIHCTATPNGKYVSVNDIDRWHRERGFKRSAECRQWQNPDLAAIGYHFVIYTNGTVATWMKSARMRKAITARELRKAFFRRKDTSCESRSDIREPPSLTSTLTDMHICRGCLNRMPTQIRFKHHADQALAPVLGFLR